MSLANPLWLLGLLALPLALLVQLAQRRRARRYAVRFTGVSNLKLAAAAAGPSWRRHLPTAFVLAALALLVTALAKPERTVAVPVGRASVMMVTDHSLSMEADDVQPDRLTAAQAAAHSFLSRIPRRVKVGAVVTTWNPASSRVRNRTWP